MKKNIILILATFFILSCQQPKTKIQSNVTISGSIRGLKKGTLHLQKIQDSTLVSLDSIIMYDNPEFNFSTFIEEPEILYLYLDKDDGAIYNDRLPFFAEPGIVNIHTKLKNFEESATIVAAKNQEKLKEFKTMKKRFDTESLRLIKVNFEAQKQNDYPKIKETQLASESIIKRKYLYTLNFAMSNVNMAVAPYVLLSEIPDANFKFLDTVANSLTPEIKNSKYGQQLIRHINNIKPKKEGVITEN